MGVCGTKEHVGLQNSTRANVELGEKDGPLKSTGVENRTRGTKDRKFNIKALEKSTFILGPTRSSGELLSSTLSGTEKTPADKAILESAIRANELLNYLEDRQIDRMVFLFEEVEFKSGDAIFNEGDQSSSWHILKSGSVGLFNGEEKIRAIGEGEELGDFGLHYPSKTTNTATCLSKAVLWSISQSTYRRMIAQEVQSSVSMLKSVPILSNLNDEQLSRVSDALRVITFRNGEYIIREGDEGREFYIIKAGNAICYGVDRGNMVSPSGLKTPEPGESSFRRPSSVAEGRVELRRLKEGDYMGEIALLNKVPRTSDVVADGDVECWVMSYEDFAELMGPLKDILDRNMKRRLLEIPSILQSLREEELEKLVDAVDLVTYEDDDFIVRQGEAGDAFYVICKGTVKATKDDPDGGNPIELQQLSDNNYFGEMALLNDEPRTANVIAIGRVTCLRLLREDFNRVLRPIQDLREHRRMEDFLASIKLFGSSVGLSEAQRTRFRDACESREFEDGQIIFRKGETSGLFYIIEEGDVQLTSEEKYDNRKSRFSQDMKAGADEEEVNVIVLHTGDYMGDYSLATDEPHKRTAIAIGKVRSIVLKKADFREILGPLLYKLEDFVDDGFIGRGGYGEVKMVHHFVSKEVYALKIVHKARLETQAERTNIVNEKRIMSILDFPFVLKLVATFQDTSSLYLLEELVQGGDLRTLLQTFPDAMMTEDQARFYSSGVVLVLEYLHNKNIVYRDLKPENILLAATGYPKVGDFGNAKEVRGKTFTLLGTPDYVAPEIWLHRGHGKGVDYWALGCLIYEFIVSITPFEQAPSDTNEQDQTELIRKIINCDMTFPYNMSSDAQDLIKRLLVIKPSKRLGCLKRGALDIRTHRWFRTIDWDAYMRMEITPPVVPEVRDEFDQTNFYFDDDEEMMQNSYNSGFVDWFDDF